MFRSCAVGRLKFSAVTSRKPPPARLLVKAIKSQSTHPTKPR